ncbi:hypothetical protein [uncultured Hyphomicrobium sp.]|jgi:hypothetical protein|uniref:hypothetical protein n=1 Tax=uncultured Hyphomicrobium sp. TaxID=194373 RepID=UPI0025E552FF|nr:hypothetical protein [uncultured Hyphomicrobium sp.]
MLIERSQLSLFTLVPAILIYVGTLFQVGYFYNFGYEFLSTVGATDWLFSIMVLAVPLVLFGLLIVYIAFGVSNLLLWQHAKLDGTAFGRFLDEIPGWLWLLLGIWFFQMLRQNFSGIGPWIETFFFIWTIGFTALVWRAFEESEYIQLRTCFWLALLWAIAAFNIGSTWAMIGGRVCNIRFNDGHEIRVVYLRAVADGHLYRVAGSAFFTAKSTISDVECEAGWNIMDLRMKITYPLYFDKPRPVFKD